MRVQSDLNSEQIQFLREVAENGIAKGYKGIGYFYIMSEGSQFGGFVRVNFEDGRQKDYSIPCYSEEIQRKYRNMVEYLRKRDYVKWFDSNIYKITSKGRQAVGLTL